MIIIDYFSLYVKKKTHVKTPGSSGLWRDMKQWFMGDGVCRIPSAAAGGGRFDVTLLPELCTSFSPPTRSGPSRAAAFTWFFPSKFPWRAQNHD